MLGNGFQIFTRKARNRRFCSWRLPRGKQILPGVGGQRPVVVFARAVDSAEGFFMQQDGKIMPLGDLLHQVHQQLVMVNGEVDFLIHRGALKLVGCNFIMACFHRDAQAVGFQFELLHECHHPCGMVPK